MTSDPDASRRFYSEVAGWGTEVWPGSNPYTMWTNGGAPIGGVTRISPELAASGMKPHWMAHVIVRDTDATIAEVKRRGGTVVHEPEDIPSVGRFAVFKDPQGAQIAAFTPNQEMPYPETPRVGDFSWHELATTDLAAALAFYSPLFEWEKQESYDMGAMGPYQLYGQKGRMYGGIYKQPPEMPGGPGWTYYVRVPNADGSAETVKRLGGTVLHGPMEVPGGDRVAMCLDPQGAMFAVHEVKPG